MKGLIKLFKLGAFLVVLLLSSYHEIRANCQGCCSWHGGIVCQNGITGCADGTSLSSKCLSNGCDACSTNGNNSSNLSPNSPSSTILNKGIISTSIPKGYVSSVPVESKHPYKKSASPKTKYRDIPSYVSPEAKRTREHISNSKTAESDSILNSRKIGYYFRLANENVGALDCNIKFHERDVSDSLNEKVRNRDGNRCVICGSATKLKVNHRRALMNGGDNSIANLGTLCDVCQTEKTSLDESLRQERENVCVIKDGETHSLSEN